MSTASPPPFAPPSPTGLHPTPPISRGGARAAILARLAAQGRSPDFLDEGAVGRLIDHARGSPRQLRAALDTTLALAAREHAAHGDAALVARALGGAAPARPIVPDRTRRALWLAGSGFAVASVLLIWFAAPMRTARVALAPVQVVSPAPSPPTHLAEAPIMQAEPPPALPKPADVAAAPAPAPPAQASPPSPAAGDQASVAAPSSPSTAPAGPAPTAAEAVTPPTLPQPAPPAPQTALAAQPAGPPTPPAPTPTAPPTAVATLAPTPTLPQAAPPGSQSASAPQPAEPPAPAPPAPAVTALAPAVGVAAPPVPATPVIAQPPTALVLYAAGAPGVQQRLSSLSMRLRQAGIGQVEKRAVPAGTALGRPVSFFDSGDLALAQRAAGVLASEGWPNLPVDELAPRMIRPRAALRQRHVVIEIQLP